MFLHHIRLLFFTDSYRHFWHIANTIQFYISFVGSTGKAVSIILMISLSLIAGKRGFMSYTKRTFDELNLLDDFLLNAIASDPEIGNDFCRTLISVLLQKDIQDLYVVAQKVIMPPTPGHRGVRLDIEARESLEFSPGLPALNIYDVEPHLYDLDKLPRHNRFYQARIDGRYLKSGTKDFSNLPNLYVLTITDKDPFDQNYMIYTVHNQCQEVPELNYNDGLVFYYFNASGTKGGTPAIKAMLNYLRNSCESNVINNDIKKLHQYVSQVKLQPEVRDEYMHLDELIAWHRRDEHNDTIVETTVNNILDLLSDYGEIPEDLKEHITDQKDISVLRHWHKLAARSASIEEFRQKIL